MKSGDGEIEANINTGNMRS